MTDTARTPGDHLDGEPLAFDDRTRRVLALRKQVREGTYRVDAAEVAAAMVREWTATSYVAVPTHSTPSVETHAERVGVAGRFIVQPTNEDAEGQTAVLSA